VEQEKKGKRSGRPNESIAEWWLEGAGKVMTRGERGRERAEGRNKNRRDKVSGNGEEKKQW